MWYAKEVAELRQDAAHNSLLQTSDAVIGATVVSSLVLGFLFPLSLAPTLPRALTFIAGGGLTLVGAVFFVVSSLQLRRERQPSEPGKPTTRLITKGIFALSRNPLYFGLLVACAGMALLFNWLWLLILLIPAMVAVRYVLIVPEERYLEAKFGEQYRQYVRSVRRWI